MRKPNAEARTFRSARSALMYHCENYGGNQDRYESSAESNWHNLHHFELCSMNTPRRLKADEKAASRKLDNYRMGWTLLCNQYNLFEMSHDGNLPIRRNLDSFATRHGDQEFDQIHSRQC
jgi:hypothetical protein